jgi:hypothetical protein
MVTGSPIQARRCFNNTYSAHFWIIERLETMAKLPVIGRRLRLRSWSIPFTRSKNSSLEEKDGKKYGYMATSKKIHATPYHRPFIPAPLPDPATSTSKLIELAQTITRETEKLNRFIKDNGLPDPSFDVDAPLNFPKLPDELQKTREEVVRATQELGELVTGPRERIRWMAWDVSHPLCTLPIISNLH